MLQYQTIEPKTLELLKSLMQKDYLQNFNLVGGTALALQIGHRKSVDFMKRCQWLKTLTIVVGGIFSVFYTV